MATVGVVGLGAMGSRIARRLGGAGHELVVWNRDPAEAESLVAAGALAAATPADAARRAEAVITMVADPRALIEVTEGTDADPDVDSRSRFDLAARGAASGRGAPRLPGPRQRGGGRVRDAQRVPRRRSGAGRALAAGPVDARHRFPPRAGRCRDGCKARRQHGAGGCDRH